MNIETWEKVRADERKAKYKQYDNKLIQIVNHLNGLQIEAEPLFREYQKILSYFRVQKQRKLITQEDYYKKAKMLKFADLKNKKRY